MPLPPTPIEKPAAHREAMARRWKTIVVVLACLVGAAVGVGSAALGPSLIALFDGTLERRTADTVDCRLSTVDGGSAR